MQGRVRARLTQGESQGMREGDECGCTSLPAAGELFRRWAYVWWRISGE